MTYDLTPFLLKNTADRTLEDCRAAVSAMADITNSVSVAIHVNHRDAAIASQLHDAWLALYNARKMLAALVEAEKVA